jgi:hypothetical protein
LCARCHGSDYSGTAWRGRRLPDFRSSAWQNSHSNAQLLVSIVEGKGTHMPAFGDRLSNAEARNLVLLIRQANPTRPAGAAMSTSTGSFATRFAALRRELNALRKEFRDLDPLPRRTGRTRDRNQPNRSMRRKE